MPENIRCSDFKKCKKGVNTSFYFIFLSLVLSILCFFIFLVHQSSFEASKVDALKTSLKNSFNTASVFQTAQPSVEASQVAIYHQSQIAKMFPNSEILQDLINDEITIFIPSSDIFYETLSDFKPTSAVLFKQIHSLLSSSIVKNKYTVDFVLFDDLTTKQNYPVYSHLSTQRLEKIKAHLDEIGIRQNAYTLGVEKGSDDKVKLHFRKRRN